MLSQIYESRTEQNIICLKCEQEKIAAQNSRKQNCLIITYKMEAGKPVKSMAVETQRRKGRSPKQGIETLQCHPLFTRALSRKGRSPKQGIETPLYTTVPSFFVTVEKEEARSRALKQICLQAPDPAYLLQKRKKPEVGH